MSARNCHIKNVRAAKEEPSVSGNLKKIAYLSSAIIYAYFANLITSKYIVPLITGLPYWVSFICFIITMLPVIWILSLLLELKDEKQNFSEPRPIQKNWWYKRKTKNTKR